jgi:hypothetical protein
MKRRPTPQVVAHHEAGHAVAAFDLKRQLYSVSIVGDAESYGRAVRGKVIISSRTTASPALASAVSSKMRSRSASLGQQPKPALQEPTRTPTAQPATGATQSISLSTSVSRQYDKQRLTLGMWR